MVQRNMIRILKPEIFRARRDLDDFVSRVLRGLRQARQCDERMQLQDFKRRVETILQQDFTEKYHWCESKYDHLEMMTKTEWTNLEQIKFRHMVAACVDTAIQLSQSEILDFAAICADDFDIQEFKRTLWLEKFRID